MNIFSALRPKEMISRYMFNEQDVEYILAQMVSSVEKGECIEVSSYYGGHFAVQIEIPKSLSEIPNKSDVSLILREMGWDRAIWEGVHVDQQGPRMDAFYHENELEKKVCYMTLVKFVDREPSKNDFNR